MVQDDFSKAIAVLDAWREARGEGNDGMRAVLNVMQNRAAAGNKTLLEICEAKNQFSSMTFTGDPELVLFPKPNDPALLYLLSIVDDVVSGNLNDITNGAQFYYNPATATSTWFTDNIVGDPVNHPQTAQIGHHVFFK